MKFPDWRNYFGDLANLNFSIPQIPDQIFLVRPEYMDVPRADDKYDYYEMMSDCSTVDYVVEDADSGLIDVVDDIEYFDDNNVPFVLQNQSKENVVEISIETPK